MRFSTVLGSRGSADTVRDTRGFATKFYTDEGTFDLVGNNIPVFFIQDGIKFPDVVHAAKPHPDREIPQAQSAHDTFWDFVSLHTEAQHHTMWNMSDRGIPRSYRTMEGFGVHTFRMVDAEGASSLVKFHWKPRLGVHSLTWEEAQMIAGFDPDFHRRDLADAIESGAFPQWELGIQVFPDTADQTFEGIDLLDPTKFVPEELAPVQLVGELTLNANPTNFFAETEQVAFHVGHLVPGIDVTDDPLLQARLFSYVDTQLTRLGGPNFSQIPVNRPHAPVNDMLRDGFHQHGVHAGVAPYRPNTLDGGCPFVAGEDLRGFVEVPAVVAESVKERSAPASYDDHFSQVRLFWRSMTPVEQEHIVRAYTFAREGLRTGGQGAPAAGPGQHRPRSVLEGGDRARSRDARADRGTERRGAEPGAFPARGDVATRRPDGRHRGGRRRDLSEVESLRAALFEAGVVPLVVASRGGTLPGGLTVQRTFLTVRSVELDAVLLAGSPAPAADALPSRDVRAADRTGVPTIDPRVSLLLDEAFRHAKVLGAWVPVARRSPPRGSRSTTREWSRTTTPARS